MHGRLYAYRTKTRGTEQANHQSDGKRGPSPLTTSHGGRGPILGRRIWVLVRSIEEGRGWDCWLYLEVMRILSVLSAFSCILPGCTLLCPLPPGRAERMADGVLCGGRHLFLWRDILHDLRPRGDPAVGRVRAGRSRGRQTGGHGHGGHGGRILTEKSRGTPARKRSLCCGDFGLAVC